MTEMEEEPKESPKHDINSYVSPVTTSPTVTSSADSTADMPPNTMRPQNAPRMVRSADHLNIAQQKQVEGKEARASVHAQHIVKIFARDDEEFIEVSPEQVERVKKSEHTWPFAFGHAVLSPSHNVLLVDATILLLAVHESIESGVYFSFNYNTLLLVASVLAGLGLVSDSGTTVIASMLVSPIMGPVVGLAYGTTITDWKLVRHSLRSEGISLLFCILVGVIIAAICGVTPLAEDWPTYEMQSRTTLSAFMVALPVAFFSGLGVAVSLLDSQTASLVGVAISASLLPPAVNAGVVWIYYAYVAAGRLPDPAEDPNTETARDVFLGRGSLSFCITLVNIFLIWLASMFMFRMKEVLPIEKKVFWEDLGIARKIYRRRALLEVVNVDSGDKKDVSESGIKDETNNDANE